MQVRLIVNPKAGQGADIEQSRKHFGQSCEMVLSHSAEHASTLAKQAVADGVDRIVAVGGDGTVNAILNGIAPEFHRVELAIVPMGTGNDLARCLGIPTELKSALRLALEAPNTPLDVGRFHNGGAPGRYFLNVSAGGFAGVVDQIAENGDKQRWGSLKYLASAVGAMRDVQTYALAISANSQRFELEAYNVIVGNGRFAARGIPVAPDACMNDGVFDIAILPAAPLVQSLLASLDILRGKHIESDKVITFRSATLEVQSQSPISFNLDGELQPEAGHLRFEMLPRQLRVVPGDHQGCVG